MHRAINPAGLAAAVMLAIVTTAGVFYLNIMGALVDGLVGGAGLSEAMAGRIGAVNIYGGSAGTLAAVLLVRRWRWRRLMAGAIMALVAIDLASLFVTGFVPLLGLRLVHGLAGGLVVGTGLAVIARTINPDRGFAVLLFVQYLLGGLAVVLLPPLVPLHGTVPLFATLAGFGLVALVLLPLLPEWPLPDMPATGPGRIDWRGLGLAMAAFFVVQAASMALNAYMIRIGLALGHSRDTVGATAGLATFVALAGPVLAIRLGPHFGRVPLVLAALVVGALGAWLLIDAHSRVQFFLAVSLGGIAWAFVIPFMLGLAATFDAEGRAAAFAGVVSQAGLATGPLLSAQLLAGGGGFGTPVAASIAGKALGGALLLLVARAISARTPAGP